MPTAEGLDTAPRPCACDRCKVGPYTPGQCRRCWLFHNDPRYNARWGGRGALGPAGLPCTHLGAPAGRSVPCRTCRGGGTALKLFGCAVHGECTPLTPLPGVACCRGCPDHLPRPDAALSVCVRMTTVGVGDCVMGLTSVAGLKHDRPSARVAYAVPRQRVGWLRLFRGPDEVLALEDLHARDFDESYGPYESYRRECRERGRLPRWEYYAQECRTTARLPPPGDNLPADALEWARPFAGAAVLAPFAAWPSRTWPLPHWLALEDALRAAGRAVVVADDRKDRCGAFRGRKVLGEPDPARVTALLKVAGVVIGNDSGVAHVAGVLGTPTVAVCGPVRGPKVFGVYPRVKCLDGKLPCSGCWWQRSVRGYTEGCNASCASLATVTPADVFAAAEGPWP